jgi:hypothetical protein
VFFVTADSRRHERSLCFVSQHCDNTADLSASRVWVTFERSEARTKKEICFFVFLYFCRVVLLEESLGLQGLKMGPHDAGKNTHILLDSFEGECVIVCKLGFKKRGYFL